MWEPCFRLQDGKPGHSALTDLPPPTHRAGGDVPPCRVAPASAHSHPPHCGRFLDRLDRPSGAHSTSEALPGELSGHGLAKLLCR